jgi:cation transport regulator ChaB
MTADAGDAEVAYRTSLAKRAFNTAWDLIDKSDRSGEEEREMLVRAAASRTSGKKSAATSD